MVKRKALSETEITDALQDLSGWSLKNGKLHKQFKFPSFAAALGWMVSVGVEADKMNHHPEWTNVYSTVTVNLITHDLNTISSWDVALAEKMNTLTK